MPTFTEGNTPGDWLQYEAPSRFSRSDCTIAAGGSYASGTVLGEVTATKEFVPWDPGAADGSETVAGILVKPVDATDAAAPGVVIDTHAIIIRTGLTFGAGVTTSAQRDAAVDQLRALGIKNV